MKVEIYSHNYAYELLQNPVYNPVYDEIIKVCKECPLPLYEGKSSKQKRLDVVQQIINTYFDLSLEEIGWKSQSPVTTDEDEDKMKADFFKKYPAYDINESANAISGGQLKIMVEVEMGNAASYYRDLCKFLLSYTKNKADFFILVVPIRQLSTRIDSGVIDFEKVKRELKMLKVNFPIPILVVGISEDQKNVWNTKGLIREELEHIKKSQVSREILVKSYMEHIINSNISCFVVDDEFKEKSARVKKSRDKLINSVNSVTKKYKKLKDFECGSKKHNEIMEEINGYNKVIQTEEKSIRNILGFDLYKKAE